MMLQPILDYLCKNRVILASQSPRRKEILELIGFKNFEIINSDFDENLNPKNFPNFPKFVEELAYQKVLDVKQNKLANKDAKSPILICGADTIVTLNNEIFGKPKDKEDAFQTLTRLSGKTNIVYTGVTLMFPEKTYKFSESTKVTFGNLTSDRINEYIQTGEPMGKAGSYGIQGYASTFIEKIDGDYYTVIGLPLYRIVEKVFDYFENYHNSNRNDK